MTDNAQSDVTVSPFEQSDDKAEEMPEIYLNGFEVVFSLSDINIVRYKYHYYNKWPSPVQIAYVIYHRQNTFDPAGYDNESTRKKYWPDDYDNGRYKGCHGG